MTAPSVTIIDYGIGNLMSVRRALEHCGATVILSSQPDEVERAERLLLPGVGAFAKGMHELRRRWLVPAILRYCERERPFLGICLGMQMMLDESEEFGQHQGLGLIPGAVRAIPKVGADGTPHPIPHIGWNGLRPMHGGSPWAGTLLDGVPEGGEVYFVHSFAAQPTQPGHGLAEVHYHGLPITAAVGRDNLYGTQFHPEKSGELGLGMIRNFLRL